MEWVIREIQINTTQWHTTVWSPEQLKLKRMTVPNIDEHVKHPESSSAGENAKILPPTGNKAWQFITNSNTHILYDLRICFLDSAQGNIKPLLHRPVLACSGVVHSYCSKPKTTQRLPARVYPYNGTLLTNKNEWTVDSRDSLNKSHMCCILMKRARLKSYILFDSMYVKFYEGRIRTGRQWPPGSGGSMQKNRIPVFGWWPFSLSQL